MEFEHISQHTQHEGGGGKTSLSLLKQKPIWLIIGAVGVVLILLLNRNKTSQSQDTSDSPSSVGGYPAPPDYGSGGGGGGSSSDGLTLNDIAGTIKDSIQSSNESLIHDQFSGWQQSTQDYIDSKNTGYDQKLEDLSKQNSDLSQKVDNLTNKPATTPTPSPTKPVAPTTAKPPINVASKPPAPAQTTAQKTVASISNPSYNGVSVVDYLKGAGVGSSMADRQKIANNIGIKNYTGTASQNTQMLKTLQADDKKKK